MYLPANQNPQKLRLKLTIVQPACLPPGPMFKFIVYLKTSTRNITPTSPRLSFLRGL